MAFISVSVFIASFGAYYYGEIRREVAGEEPQQVKLILKNENSSLKNILVDNDNKGRVVSLV